MTYTWLDATKRWCTEMKEKRTITQDIQKFKNLAQFLDHKSLDEITQNDIYTIVRQKELTGAQPATINRTLSLLRALFNKAYKEWGWKHNPPIYIKVKKEKQSRTRWLKKSEIIELKKYLPRHLSLMVDFTLATGLRASNLLNLQWADIDFETRILTIHADNFKNGKEHTIPLNQTALLILHQVYQQHSIWVFTYNKHRITQCNTRTFRNALKLAHITDFRWHDLRHTWASHHIQAGTPLHILQRLGGWASFNQVLKYAHHDLKQLADASENINCA
jgi:integrase